LVGVGPPRAYPPKSSVRAGLANPRSTAEWDQTEHAWLTEGLRRSMLQTVREYGPQVSEPQHKYKFEVQNYSSNKKILVYNFFTNVYKK
jgi:hypothetical protein